MTDHPPSDELISAHLDDEATPAEAAAVEASAPARARRDQLEAARALVGQPVVPPPEAREAAVAAALAVFDREIAAPAAPEQPDGATPTPTPLAGRRVRRRSPLVAVLGAAASIVFLLAVGVISLSQRSHTESFSAGAAPESQSADKGVASSGASSVAPAAPSGADTARDDFARATGPDAFAAPVDLGAVAGAAELRERVAAGLAAPAPMAPLTSAPGAAAAALDAVASCEPAQRAADPGLGPLVLTARATYQGRPAVVLAYRAEPNGPVRAILAEPGSCRVLLVDPG